MPRHARLAVSVAATLLVVAGAGPARSQNNPENDPDFCVKIWKDVGVPLPPRHGKETIVCHLGYIVGHNDSAKTPYWVIERLTPDIVSGTATRGGLDFLPDGKLPADAQAQPKDYDGNGFNFDKGHNAPADDFGKQDFLKDTFFYSNAVPQIGKGFNQSIWRSLEGKVHKLVGDNHPVLFIITGPVPQDDKPIKIDDVCGAKLELPVVTPTSICPENHNKKNVTCAAGVAVPSAMFKIVYDPVMQNAFAVLMENESHTGRYTKTDPYIDAHRVSIATIENLTGLRFFTALPTRKQNQIRNNCVAFKQH